MIKVKLPWGKLFLWRSRLNYKAELIFHSFCLLLTVKPPLWFELLSEHREIVISQHSGIQSIHSLPGVCGGVRCLPVVLHWHPVERYVKVRRSLGSRNEAKSAKKKKKEPTLRLWRWAGMQHPAELDEPWRRGRCRRRPPRSSGQFYPRLLLLREFPEQLSGGKSAQTLKHPLMYLYQSAVLASYIEVYSLVDCWRKNSKSSYC